MTPTSPSQSRRQFLVGAVAAGTAAALPAHSGPSHQSARSPVVLVHGASHLASDGIKLSTHIDDVVNDIKWKDLDHAVLVGHS